MIQDVVGLIVKAELLPELWGLLVEIGFPRDGLGDEFCSSDDGPTQPAQLTIPLTVTQAARSQVAWRTCNDLLGAVTTYYVSRASPPHEALPR